MFPSPNRQTCVEEFNLKQASIHVAKTEHLHKPQQRIHSTEKNKHESPIIKNNNTWSRSFSSSLFLYLRLATTGGNKLLQNSTISFKFLCDIFSRKMTLLKMTVTFSFEKIFYSFSFHSNFFYQSESRYGFMPLSPSVIRQSICSADETSRNSSYDKSEHVPFFILSFH